MHSHSDGHVTRDRLIAHTQGDASARDRWELEMAATTDPLLQDALDGLNEPGAVDALRTLQRPSHIPAGGPKAQWWLLGTAIFAGIAGVWWWNTDQGPAPIDHATNGQAVPEQVLPSVVSDAAADAIAALPTGTEIDAANEVPAPLRIGHGPKDRHILPEAVTHDIVRDPAPEPIAPVAVQPGPAAAEAPAPAPLHRKRTSLQLVFLHGLKLVHPKELHGHDASLRIDDHGVDAAYSDRDAQARASADTRMMGYLSFMDEAMARFARSDHRGCLEELRFLLRQYPTDVNATFYAGLCAYNLGLYERAETLLGKAAMHGVDVFDEEAAWYHALTLQRLGEHERARERMAHIAQDGGFYAERARELIGTR